MDRNKGHYRKNVADDIATVQTMLCGFHDHPFMQEIVQIKGKPASVILYLEDNLKEIQQFCTRVQITRAFLELTGHLTLVHVLQQPLCIIIRKGTSLNYAWCYILTLGQSLHHIS